MRQVTLDELMNMACDSRVAIWDKAVANGREPKIYLHWTGGRYGQFSDKYHINIDFDGTVYVATEDLSETMEHTWKRNSGAVGIVLNCGWGAGSNTLGNYPPTEAQIETMAQVIQTVSDALWLTIDKPHVMTHGEAADNEDALYVHKPYAWWNDGYKDGDTRGDLEYLGTEESPKYNPWAIDGSRGGDVLRGKANWYRNQARDKATKH